MPAVIQSQGYFHVLVKVCYRFYSNSTQGDLFMCMADAPYNLITTTTTTAITTTTNNNLHYGGL